MCSDVGTRDIDQPRLNSQSWGGGEGVGTGLGAPLLSVPGLPDVSVAGLEYTALAGLL